MNTFELQAHLTAMGHSPGAIDGKIGPKTLGAARNLIKAHGATPSLIASFRNNSRVQVGAEQLIMREIGGLAVGPIDGIVGPATRKARAHWQRGPWRNAVMQRFDADARMPRALDSWPLQRDMAEFFGRPGTGLTQASVPYRLKLAWQPNTHVSRITMHKKIVEPTLAAMEQIAKDYSRRDIDRLRLNVWGGCYSPRPMRGGTALSTHAYGIAHDWDPTRNPLRWGRDRAAFAGPEYEAFWSAWTAQGALSLGKARDFDWMHLQFARLG